MIFNIACVGKIKESYYTELIEEYGNSLCNGNQLIIRQVADEPISRNAGDAIYTKLIKAEGERLLANIGKDEYVIALCIEGKQTNTKTLQHIIHKASDKGCKVVTFVIGGSLGLDDRCVKRADYKLSFSRMTYPHQLMRVMLAEQIKLICDM